MMMSDSDYIEIIVIKMHLIFIHYPQIDLLFEIFLFFCSFRSIIQFNFLSLLINLIRI